MGTRIITVQLSLLMLVLTVNCNRQAETNSTPVQDHMPSLKITNDGAWCWFSDPRAVYYEGAYQRTYAGWVDAQGNIVVGFYDHELDTVDYTVIHPELQVDDHNNPSLMMDSEGKLMVLYSKHSSKSPMLMARAKSPESIENWEAIQPLVLNDSTLFEAASNTYTYTNIVRLSDEEDKLYLFWRGVDFKPNYASSVDNGYSWSSGDILILPERTYRNRRPYLKVGTNNKDIIHFAFTDGHPRNEPTNSIYYAKYRDQHLYKADGSKIKSWLDLPLDPAESDLVYDATQTKEKAWIWDVADDSEGSPVIVYSRFPDDSTHVYYYAFWNEDGWKNVKLVNSGGWFPQTRESEIEREPNYSGGIALDHTNPSIVYLSVNKNGVFEIERWKTKDGGQNWEINPVTQHSSRDNIRPFVARNSGSVLWMNLQHYYHYTDYRASLHMKSP